MLHAAAIAEDRAELGARAGAGDHRSRESAVVADHDIIEILVVCSEDQSVIMSEIICCDKIRR